MGAGSAAVRSREHEVAAASPRLDRKEAFGAARCGTAPRNGPHGSGAEAVVVPGDVPPHDVLRRIRAKWIKRNL